MSTVPAGTERLRAPVLAGVLGKVAEAVTLVLLATVVPRLLGPYDYGLFSVVLTLVAIGSVALTLGGATLLGRYVPAAAPADRGPLARTMTLRLARNRAALFLALVVVAGLLVLADPARFPPLPTAFVLVALALNVAATLALQAGLGLGRATAWSARYPVQNGVLIAAVFVLYAAAGVTGAMGAVVVAAVAAAVLGAVAAAPLRHAGPSVAFPEGAARFGVLQAASGALGQVAQRGGVVAVALLAGSGLETGYAALAVGVALAATYAVVQLFTVSLPVLTRRHAGGGADPEATLRRLAGVLLAVTLPAMAAAVLVLDVAVPVAFGADYAAATGAFGPALAMVVLAPVNALLVQAAALRLRSEVLLRATATGAVVFAAVAVAAVPSWGAVGATTALLAGAAGTALVAVLGLPGAAGARLVAASLGGSVAVAALGVLT
ncbi:oligosaccharide flippase family protein [Pseudonocardia sp.]|uniref:oligosaccharide flippase family protein n=1 Tax=Pseudonocardia sp. TaxID=60912 RepID=UPI002605EB6A|nr:oligosaccharide flippase family protein [Pseudonocardia sp.]